MLRYKGVFDFDGLYKMMHAWLISKRYEFHETKYKDKVSTPFGNEIEVEWTGEKKINEFVKQKIVIEFHLWDFAEVEVIKAFSIDASTTDIDALVADYDAVCDYYLFDTADSAAKGGTGKQFDWKLLTKAKIEKPFFLSGGISLEDMDKIKKFKHPDFFGIDINSRFEKEPGVKDMALILQCKQALK